MILFVQNCLMNGTMYNLGVLDFLADFKRGTVAIFNNHFKKLKKVHINVSPQIMV